MFRGIDPAGLHGLATEVETQSRAMRLRSEPALEMLRRHGAAGAVEEIGSIARLIEAWGLAIGHDLRQRAALIRRGQETASLRPPRLGSARVAGSPVDRAITDIVRWLHQGWSDWDVTNTDLHNIATTLMRLSASELHDVIAALSPHQLQRWIAEMGGNINGFSRTEKQDLFRFLSARIPGWALGKIHHAILIGGTTQDAIDLGLAIQYHSPDRVIVDFIIYAVEQDLSDFPYSGVAPAIAADGIEDTKAIDRIASALVTTDGALAVMVGDDLVGAKAAITDACVEINPIGSLVHALGRGDDRALKALGFAAIAGLATDTGLRAENRHLGVGSDGGNGDASRLARIAEAEMLQHATRLFASDANGIVEHLATSIDQEGSLTTSLLYRLIDHDMFDDLGRIADALRGGNEVDSVRFSDRGGDAEYDYPHAQNLAFVAGALTNALARHADDAKHDVDTITRLAAVASFVVGHVYGGASWVLGAVGASTDFGVSEVLGANTQRNIDAGFKSLALDVEKAFQPIKGDRDTEPPNLFAAFQRWLHRYRTTSDW